MERHFPTKPGQPIGMALAMFYPFFPDYLIRAKNWFSMKWNANLVRNIPTEISGPLFRSEESETEFQESLA